MSTDSRLKVKVTDRNPFGGPRRTAEEWRADMRKVVDRYRNGFYADICAYVRGEANVMGHGSVGETMGKIAKVLVEADPTLLRPENKNRLLAELDHVRSWPRFVRTLSQEDLAVLALIFAQV